MINHYWANTEVKLIVTDNGKDVGNDLVQPSHYTDEESEDQKKQNDTYEQTFSI